METSNGLDEPKLLYFMLHFPLLHIMATMGQFFFTFFAKYCVLSCVKPHRNWRSIVWNNSSPPYINLSFVHPYVPPFVCVSITFFLNPYSTAICTSLLAQHMKMFMPLWILISDVVFFYFKDFPD